MASYSVLDDLVKEYLLFRGFASTLKSFDNDLKIEKEKTFRADRLIDQMMGFISNYDLTALRDLWQHLQIRIFKRLDPAQNGSALRMESGILKLYLVNCVQTKRQEKIKEFFDKMALELQGTPDWRDWFALPFLQNPETHPTFQNHFSRQWQDTLLLSLHNFLAIVFARLPAPRLAEFQSSANKIKKLRDENAALKQSIVRQKQAGNFESASCIRFPDVGIQPRDLMDDFYIIAQQDNVANQPSGNETQVKTLKSFLRNITGGSVTSTGTPSPSHSSASLLQTGVDRKPKRSEDRTETLRKSFGDSVTNKTNHTPLKRVAKSVPSFAPESQATVMESSATGKLAYLLLGQEDYKEHNSEVTQCRFSGSRCIIGSCDIDGVVKVWSAAPGIPHTKATFISNASVTSLDWFPHSDKHFVYGSSNGIFRICDVEERKVITELQTSPAGSIQSVHQLSCSPNNGHIIAVSVASVGEPVMKGSLMLYDIKSNNYLERDLCGTLEGSVGGLVPVMTSILFNHNCQMLITGATDGKIRIFDLRKRECIASWTVCGDGKTATSRNVLSLQLSSDETKIFALTADGLFSSWSFVQTSQKLSGSHLDDPYFHEAPSYPRSFWGKQFAFAADGTHFLCSSTSGGVIYNMKPGGEVEKVLGLRGHPSHTTCTDWSLSNDCGPCVTAGADGVIRVSTLLSQ